MALTGNVHKDLKNPIDATIVTIMAKHNPINTTILPQHKQTGKTGPSPMSFLSPAVNLGAFGCVPASRSWVNMGSVSAARSRSPCDGLEMRKVEQEALRRVLAELNRVQSTVKILELQVHSERKEKNAWKSKYEQLEKANKGKEALLPGNTSVPRTTLVASATIEGAVPVPAARVLRSTYAPPAATPTPAALQRVRAINPAPCWDYYLGWQGCPYGTAIPGRAPCMFPHHHRFTPEEHLALRYTVQRVRCTSGLNCLNKLCFYGHQCMVLEGGICQGGASCQFKEEEHLPEKLAGDSRTNVVATDNVMVPTTVPAVHISPPPGEVDVKKLTEQLDIALNLVVRKTDTSRSEETEKGSNTKDTGKPDVDEDLLVWDEEGDMGLKSVNKLSIPGGFDEEWDAPIPESLRFAPVAPVASVAPVAPVALNDEIDLLEL